MLAGGLARPGEAQLGATPTPTPTVQLHALVTAGRPTFVGMGIGAGFRTAGRLGASVGLAAGDRDGRAGRVEGLLAYHLDPRRRTGLGGYVGGGLAFETPERHEYLVAFLGVESNPARKTGWFLEIGVGGGVRTAAGFRVRPGHGRS